MIEKLTWVQSVLDKADNIVGSAGRHDVGIELCQVWNFIEQLKELAVN